MHPEPSDLLARADRLSAIRNLIDDLACEAAELVQGTGDILARARSGWLDHLDRAIGCEPTTTIEDTVNDLRETAAERLAVLAEVD